MAAADREESSVDTLAYTLQLRAFVCQQEKYWESVCPSLAVYSQGDSEEEAKANLREAVELWLESCLERKTLPQALRELGWQPVPEGWPQLEDTDTIRVSRIESPEHGHPFPVELTIPAYQAALFSGGASATPC